MQIQNRNMESINIFGLLIVTVKMKIWYYFDLSPDRNKFRTHCISHVNNDRNKFLSNQWCDIISSMWNNLDEVKLT